MSDALYYVYREGLQLGLYTRAELRHRVLAGQIALEDRCSTHEMDVFYRVGEILENRKAVEEDEEDEEEDFRFMREFERMPLAGETSVWRPLLTKEQEDGGGDENEVDVDFEDCDEDDEGFEDEDQETLEGKEGTGEGGEDDDYPTVGNEIVYRGHPTYLAFINRLIFAALCLGGAYFGAGTSVSFVVGGAVGAFLCFGSIFVERKLTTYIVTKRRVELIEGFVAKSSREIRIADIRAINVDRPGFRGLYGVGTVQFSSAGSDDVEVAFRDVWRAQKVKSLIRSLQDGG
jgi:membrane protein YdbS with pleckstrin-like domain